jgi:hypothetical protein
MATILFRPASGGPVRLDALGVRGIEVPPRHLQIIVGLQVHPELRAVAEVQAEPQRRVRRDAPPIIDDLGDPVRRNADRLCNYLSNMRIIQYVMKNVNLNIIVLRN